MAWLRSAALASCLLLLDPDQALVEASRAHADPLFTGQLPVAQPVRPARASYSGYSLGIQPYFPSKALVVADKHQIIDPAAEDMFKLSRAVQREWGKLEPSQLTKVDPSEASWEENGFPERDPPFDLYEVQTIQGPRLIKHFRMSTDEEVKAAQNEVQSMAKMKRKNVFLSFYGTAQTDCDGCEGQGMLAMTEPFAGNLQDVLSQHEGKLSLKKLLSFFVDIADGMRKLRKNGVAHDPPTLDKVLVVGDVDDLDHASVVLCSSLTNTGMRVCNLPGFLWRRMDIDTDTEFADMNELEKADVKALGTLLMQMIRAVEKVEDEVFTDAMAKIHDLAAQMVLATYSDRPMDLSRLAALAKGIQRIVDPKTGFPFEKELRMAAPILPVLAVMLFKPDVGNDASADSLISKLQQSLKRTFKEKVEEEEHVDEVENEDLEEVLDDTESLLLSWPAEGFQETTH